MSIEIGITALHRNAVASELEKILADETILYLKTKNAHWNIESETFMDKHLLFEKQFLQLNEVIDSIAERIRTLGFFAPATLQAYLDLTHLTEQSRGKNDSEGFIRLLLADHECLIIILREHIRLFANELNDAGSSDFICGIMQTHEKMAWFLRSHLSN
jgi:starvation-inducible DNA-binding protein